MKLKARHVIWLLFLLMVIAYAGFYHFGGPSLRASDGPGRCAMAGMLMLIVLVIGTVLERRSDPPK
jgi:hypothetical protein